MGKRFGGKPGDCPVSESMSDQLLGLPFYNDLTEEDQRRVIDNIKGFRWPKAIAALVEANKKLPFVSTNMRSSCERADLRSLMKRCLECGKVFAGSAWACPSCGFEPARMAGHLAFAQEKAEASEGFEPGYFSRLSEMEANSFWFRSRELASVLGTPALFLRGKELSRGRLWNRLCSLGSQGKFPVAEVARQ